MVDRSSIHFVIPPGYNSKVRFSRMKPMPMDPPPLTPPVRSLEFYFADGNVVFQVCT